MNPKVENLITTNRELQIFKDIVQTIITQYEDESGTYLSDLYAKVDEIDSVDALKQIVNNYWKVGA